MKFKAIATIVLIVVLVSLAACFPNLVSSGNAPVAVETE
jgi:hypothetical protein